VPNIVICKYDICKGWSIKKNRLYFVVKGRQSIIMYCVYVNTYLYLMWDWFESAFIGINSGPYAALLGKAGKRGVMLISDTPLHSQ
jgi:hypothetical protein